MIFNRPKRLNAFNDPMMEMIFLNLNEWERSKDIGMILLKGQGRALGSGADIKALSSIIKNPSKHHELDTFIDRVYETTQLIERMKKPIVTFMNGLTVGGACSFSVLSGFNIATENTKVIMPETRFGHFCDVGSSFYLPRLNGNIGKYIALTAQTVNAEDVLLSGLATHFVPSKQLPHVEDCLVNLDQPSNYTIGKILDKFSIKPDEISIGNILYGKKKTVINRCFGFDTILEIIPALEKEGSKFSLDTIDQICQGSPISEALTLEIMRRGSRLSFSECLHMERDLWKISPYEPDFYEGVISTMVEKRKPRWSCESHLYIDFENDIVARYFRNKN